MNKLCKIVQTICEQQEIQSVMIVPGDIDADSDVIDVVTEASVTNATIYNEGYPFDDTFELVVFCNQCDVNAVDFIKTAKTVVIDETGGRGSLSRRRTNSLHHNGSQKKNSAYLDRSDPNIIVYSDYTLTQEISQLTNYVEVEPHTGTTPDPSFLVLDEEGDETVQSEAQEDIIWNPNN